MYNLVIMVSDPGGYICAIQTAQKKLRVAMVEKHGIKVNTLQVN